MRTRTLLLMGFVVLLSGLPTASAVTWQDQMLSSINSIRAEKSLTPLQMCRPLIIAALGSVEDSS